MLYRTGEVSVPGGLGRERLRGADLHGCGQVTELWGFHREFAGFSRRLLLMASDPPTQVPTSYPSSSPYPTKIDTKPPVPAAGVLCSTVKRSPYASVLMYVLAVQAGREPTARRRSASKNVRIEENASRRTRARASTALCGNQPVSLAISAPRPSERPKLGHDLREIHSSQ